MMEVAVLVMVEFRGQVSVSFRDIEEKLWRESRELFCSALQEILELLDDKLFEGYDRERYKVRERVYRELETLVGTVGFHRRAYVDRQTGETVYLLDEVLDLSERKRISPGLMVVLAELGVMGPSYREARNAAARIFGERVVSHETIRQIVKQVGQHLDAEEQKLRDSPAGTRCVPVLFLEVDGWWVSLQREKKPSQEVCALISHEGWRPRHPRSREYELVNRLHFTWEQGAGEFWEEASRYLAGHYDLENTVVIINGDRASWIRKGVNYFPRAIYQVDRFHLLRDLKRLLVNQPDRLAIAKQAVQNGDEGALLATLAEAASRERDRKLQDRIRAFLNDVISIPEALRDYRVRLEEMGLSTDGYHGLGAAESQVDRYSNRVKKRGQSWTLVGLRAILAGLNARFEGRLTKAAEAVEHQEQILCRKRLESGIGRIVRNIATDASEALRVHLPILENGRGVFPTVDPACYESCAIQEWH